MRRILVFSFVVTLLALALPLLEGPTAHATEPTPVSGTLQLTSEVITESRFAGGNEIVTMVGTLVLTGDLAGTCDLQQVVVAHATGSLNIRTVATCSLDGSSGTYVLRAAVREVAGQNPTRWVIQGGTGDLADLRGQGTGWGPGDAVQNYSGQVHFDPS